MFFKNYKKSRGTGVLLLLAHPLLLHFFQSTLGWRSVTLLAIERPIIYGLPTPVATTCKAESENKPMLNMGLIFHFLMPPFCYFLHIFLQMLQMFICNTKISWPALLHLSHSKLKACLLIVDVFPSVPLGILFVN